MRIARFIDNLSLTQPSLARIFWTFYIRSRSVNQFLATNGEVSRNRFLRVLAIGCLNIVFTLPQGIVYTVNMAIMLHLNTAQDNTSIWYDGWTFIHSNWDPKSLSLERFWAKQSQLVRVDINFGIWTSIILAFAIFALFGVSKAARESYWRIICSIARVAGVDLAGRMKERRGTLSQK